MDAVGTRPTRPARAMRPFTLGLAVAGIAFGLDRLAKLWLVSLFGGEFGPPIRLAPFFDIVMVWNHGVSFGMFQAGEGIGRIALIAVAATILVLLLVWLWRTRDLLLATALGLIIGGAVGNVGDRLIWGAVADFFSAHAFGYSFPAFNVADSAITIGVALLFLDAFRSQRGERPEDEGSHA